MERYPIFNIYTTDEGNVGNYTMEITMVLDNIALFNTLDPDMADYISDINDPVETYSSKDT